MSDARFWAAYIDWHVRTEHGWDVALHVEAMSLNIASVGREIAERLMPAIENAAAAIRAMLATLDKATS